MNRTPGSFGQNTDLIDQQDFEEEHSPSDDEFFSDQLSSTTEEFSLNLLTDLPYELQSEIVNRLLPEEIWNLEDANTYFNKVLKDPIIWRKRLQLHFPHLFDRYKDNPSTDWYSLFKEIYKASLFKLNRQDRQLFAQAKEGLLTLDDIEKYGFSKLELKDSDARTLYDWIVSTMMQSILDSLYTVILNSCFTNSNKDKQNRTRLHWAVQNNQALSIIKDLISVYNIKAVDKSGDTPLALAAKYGHLEHAKFLWQEEMRLLGYITNRNKLLGLALFNGHFELAKFLLQQGISPNEKTELGYRPLCIAARRGDPVLINFLLENGALVNDTSTTAEVSALYIAVQNGHYDAAKALLDAQGVDVNISCKNGATPLAIAIQKSNAPMVALLLKYGASVETTLGDKLTVLSFAERFKDKDNGKILSLLKKEIENKATISAFARSNLGLFAMSEPDHNSNSLAEDTRVEDDELCNYRH